uniref:BrnA antitoxin family protein n=1 Tax=Cupriavidus yeoncheonensis TaxID=1462994 RepID=UPI003F498B49
MNNNDPATPMDAAPVQRASGRHQTRRVALTVRYDPEVIAAFRATGRGWQSRMNDALKDWLRSRADARTSAQDTTDRIPCQVLWLLANSGCTPIQAWRLYLQLTQTEVAARIGISQAAYARQERNRELGEYARDQIATALGLSPDLLRIDLR